MPTSRLARFVQDASRARDLVGLGQGLGSMTHGRVDGSDLYRSALAQGVAALDAYVHGVTLDRAVDMLLGRLATTGAATKIGLHFNAIQDILVAPTPAGVELAARQHIAQRLALETFQQPDAIGRALSMVGVPKVWPTAFPNDSASVKTELGLIVARRNRIVHTCDVDPLTPGAVTPLRDADAVDSIATIERIVAALDQLC
jgi:hypothetical protein